MFRLAFCSVVLTAFYGTAQLESSGAIGDFHSWTLVNKVPVRVSAVFDGLCRGMTPAERQLSATDPHKETFISVYVNPVGSHAMQTGDVFPVGTVLVNEKHAGTTGPAKLSTVMIKQAKGFNPACGDWEFMTLDATGQKIMSRGKLASCMACHEIQRKLDFTFRNYLPKR